MTLTEEPTLTAAGDTIRLVGVDKRFDGDVVGVRDLTLDIHDRELLVLLGPSGCGKSTTLNILAGLEEPTRGDVFFGAERVTRTPAEDRDVSMVFQSIALYPHLNVRQNIEFALRHRRTPREVIDERVNTLTDLLGIGEQLGRKIHQLSGGQRQRVAIAKALVKRPRLFLLDEPFTALDADMRRQLRAELVRLHRELETTMVFVTHDQEEAMAVADRIAILNEGRVVQVGAPLDAYFDPADLWVAQFVGNHPINVLEVAAGAPGRLRLTAEDVEVPGPPWLHEAVAGHPGPVLAGLRPELVGLRGPEQGEPRATVFTRQVLGSSILYEVSLAGGTRLRAVTSSLGSWEVRQEVSFEIEWSRCLLFDRETGARIRVDAGSGA